MQKTFPVVIETDADGGFSAFYPDFPGCAGAGDTVTECFIDAVEALTLHLAGMVEDGEKIPNPTEMDDLEVDDDIQVADIMLAVVTVPGRKTRINTTLDSAVLAAIDSVTTNRSAFLEDAAIAELKRRSIAS
ncbi:hypothetical protein TH9_05630 [Thalassospira xiamenensis]|uniref:type II toxin-antitoxin system HicB family antitoxin n=1 Tax=Thalassospira xiamenensis TaxID=220697 RepID=UPI000DEDF73F|nr:type II toxin-antitoxin system HicB family antitoxin [Thalassospira xiamenensis]RCK36131.1 hypothetical protein TH9_05630 [Thalassospira xiamenensis]